MLWERSTIDGPGSKLITKSPILGRNGGNGGDTNIGQGGGTGVVNVTNGGTFENGWWIIIGRDGGANGTLNVDGAGSLVTVGGTGVDARLSVGTHNTSTGTLNIFNGGAVIADTNGEGTMIGQDTGATGFMNISGGGTFTSNRWLVIGNATNSNGTVTLSDPGSTINLTGAHDPGNEQESSRLFVGRFGNGTLNQSEGTIIVGGWSAIALDPGSVGTYNLSGGTIQARAVEENFDFFVGRAGADIANGLPGSKGTLNISENGHMAFSTDAANPDIGQRNGARVIAGTDYGSEGTINMDGGTLEARYLTVGLNGKGTMNQNSGTVNIGQWLKVGEGYALDDATNTATYNMNGGTVSTPELIVGEGRRGEMFVNDGTVNITNGAFSVGRWGPGFDGAANPAPHGNGLLSQSGGTINAAADMSLGVQTGAIGQYNISGGTLNLGLNGLRNLIVGESGAGTMNVIGGQVTGVNQLNVAANAGATGTLSISLPNPTDKLIAREFYVGNGAGAVGVTNISNGVLEVSGWSEVGRNGGTGTLSIDGPGAGFIVSATEVNRDMIVGYNSGANGTLNILNGGQFTAKWWLNIGRGAGSVGTVVVDGPGSTLTNTSGQINVGEDGIGSLTISNGGVVNMVPGGESRDFIVGRNPGSQGALNINGGTLITQGWAYIGLTNTSSGTVTMDDGRFTTADWLVVGNDGGSQGTFNLLGGEVTSTGAFFAGRFGNGTFNQTGGKLTTNGWSLVGSDAGSRGVFNLDGGEWVQNSDNLIIGRQSKANDVNAPGSEVNISGTGVYRHLAGSIYVGNEQHGHGTLAVSGNGRPRQFERRVECRTRIWKSRWRQWRRTARSAGGLLQCFRQRQRSGEHHLGWPWLGCGSRPESRGAAEFHPWNPVPSRGHDGNDWWQRDFQQLDRHRPRRRKRYFEHDRGNLDRLD